jgi:hypothetical protein
VIGATSESVIGETLRFLSSVLSCHCYTRSILPLCPGIVFENFASATASVNPLVWSAISLILSVITHKSS